MPEQTVVTRPETLTAEELIARAEELVPVLAERAARTEEERRVLDETVRDLVDAGLIRVATPGTYGGHGVDIDTLFEVGWRLGKGCGATAWFYTVTQSHNWMMGMATKEAQDEYFQSPDVISSSAYAPTGKAESAEGSWLISGRWPFSSGVDHAEWVFLGAIDPASKRLVYLQVPRSDITILDDWHPAGLRGTGSKSVVIDDPVFVPEYRAIWPGPVNPEARDRHGRASYGVPLRQVMPFVLATPLIGLAQGAVEVYTQRTKNRVVKLGSSQKSAAESPGPQFRIAESAAEADAAVAILRADLRELIEFGARDEPMSDIDRARYRRNHCYTTKLAVNAVNRIYDAAGANAILDPSPLARIHRDVNAGSHQVALLWDDIAELYGRVRLGVEPSAAMW
ncbi:acyl-CoA dehydrogenase family protein [Streptomyces sp. NPDC091280]|uniref:acyl-CoA dehydrogenase family protein n=1 Tax=Streptomyces sp. NPDC091280 TaxID=3365984 RepID=UPI00382AF007